MSACIFCKIIKGALYHIYELGAVKLFDQCSIGDIPAFKLFESEKVLAFLDIQPLSRGHAVRSPATRKDAGSLIALQMVIPKHHGAKLTDIPDDQLTEILPVAKKLVLASGATNYNILQNNGRLAHQEVDHV